jgi:hypothetical protein
MQQLRERGIYTLPDEGELVAHAVSLVAAMFSTLRWLGNFLACTPTNLMGGATFTYMGGPPAGTSKI